MNGISNVKNMYGQLNTIQRSIVYIEYYFFGCTFEMNCVITRCPCYLSMIGLVSYNTSLYNACI